ncbi:helix-turn-helix domain-containing protein [Streptomyces sp. NPDC003077]|uniref:TetR/AcrR family transcriptional regulator n=1 Tax=Streptomyces sp. NPDC003077 TaxID=3154443 RepID=UPI0033BD1548
MDHTERGERILRVARELLLAWGYQRVTIDDIARRAEVGKGTVYLHWKTKESLFLSVVLEAKMRGHRRQLERLRADPREILLSRMMSGAFLDTAGDPVLRALYLDDGDVLGRLNGVAKKEYAELIEETHGCLRRQLEILRDHGLVRTDMEVAHQHYALLAMSSGFFSAEVLLADRAPDTPEVRAGLLARTVHDALETPAAPAPPSGPDGTRGDGPEDAALDEATAALTAAAPEIVALYERIHEAVQQEMRRHLRA